MIAIAEKLHMERKNCLNQGTEGHIEAGCCSKQMDTNGSHENVTVENDVQQSQGQDPIERIAKPLQ